MHTPLFTLIVMLLLPLFVCCSVLGSLTSRRVLSTTRGGGEDSCLEKSKYRVVQVQVIHRHGDRTPITPCDDEEFWQSTLIKPRLLGIISENTEIIHAGYKRRSHSAKGEGPFGKLTQLGLLQMVKVGEELREYISSNFRPLTTKDIRVVCTDFPRTIQSVQGVLVGLFPDGLEEKVEIDCRHTSWMIPDPQPRRCEEQKRTEKELARRPHMLEREKDMYPLAVRCTNALRPLLGHGSFDLSFGVDGSDEEKEKEILSWSQLAEVTCCLKVRDRLPEGITREDQEALSSYLAWRWFETLRHPRLAFLAMHKFADSIIYRMKHVDEESPLTLYSAHDSSLVGLLCVFRLEQPSEWPEYGSNLKIVLLEKSSIENDTEYVVRFYLNGSLLRSEWHGELREEISLLILDHYVSTEGAGKVQ